MFKFFHVLILGINISAWNVCCKVMTIKSIESTITGIIVRIIGVS